VAGAWSYLDGRWRNLNALVADMPRLGVELNRWAAPTAAGLCFDNLSSKASIRSQWLLPGAKCNGSLCRSSSILFASQNIQLKWATSRNPNRTK
jgi:hypothetical protein